MDTQQAEDARIIQEVCQPSGDGRASVQLNPSTLYSPEGFALVNEGEVTLTATAIENRPKSAGTRLVRLMIGSWRPLSLSFLFE